MFTTDFTIPDDRPDGKHGELYIVFKDEVQTAMNVAYNTIKRRGVVDINFKLHDPIKLDFTFEGNKKAPVKLLKSANKYVKNLTEPVDIIVVSRKHESKILYLVSKINALMFAQKTHTNTESYIHYLRVEVMNQLIETLSGRFKTYNEIWIEALSYYKNVTVINNGEMKKFITCPIIIPPENEENYLPLIIDERRRPQTVLKLVSNNTIEAKVAIINKYNYLFIKPSEISYNNVTHINTGINDITAADELHRFMLGEWIDYHAQYCYDLIDNGGVITVHAIVIDDNIAIRTPVIDPKRTIAEFLIKCLGIKTLCKFDIVSAVDLCLNIVDEEQKYNLTFRTTELLGSLINEIDFDNKDPFKISDDNLLMLREPSDDMEIDKREKLDLSNSMFNYVKVSGKPALFCGYSIDEVEHYIPDGLYCYAVKIDDNDYLSEGTVIINFKLNDDEVPKSNKDIEYMHYYITLNDYINKRKNNSIVVIAPNTATVGELLGANKNINFSDLCNNSVNISNFSSDEGDELTNKLLRTTDDKYPVTIVLVDTSELSKSMTAEELVNIYWKFENPYLMHAIKLAKHIIITESSSIEISQDQICDALKNLLSMK